MPKNLLKRNVLEPRNLETDKMYLKHGYRMKTEFSKYSIHFENSTCKFYIYRDQFPEYITQKIASVPNLFSKGGGEPDSEYRISESSILELEAKIKEIFTFYLTEYVKIERRKKILLKFRNNVYENAVNIGIEYSVFVEKSYYGENGQIEKIKNVHYNIDEREFDTGSGHIFDYSEVLEKRIVVMQKNLSSNMKKFIDSVLENKELLANLKDNPLIKQIERDARGFDAAI